MTGDAMSIAVESVREEQQPGWWAVYTKHQHEKRVAELLTQKGVEIFLPLYGTAHRWKDRSVKLALPLFPCYIFIRQNPAVRLAIVTTPGVFQVVGNGSGYGVIPHSEIENLRKAVGGPRGVQPHPFLNAGERVSVVSGPLAGIEGILTRRKNVFRVVLSVQMLAQSAAVEVSEWEIAPVLRHWIPSADRALLPSEPECQVQ